MPYFKEFSISGTPFCGWTTRIDLDQINSIADIIKEVKTRLRTWIKKAELATGQSDMYGLKRAVDDFDPHIHDLEFGDILISNEPIMYLCQH